MRFFNWLFSRAPKDDPMMIEYWVARMYPRPNTLCVAYRWGLVDDKGLSLPEPHISRETE